VLKTVPPQISAKGAAYCYGQINGEISAYAGPKREVLKR